MLELILTRPFERLIVDAAQGLRFLVLDELHTYRAGRAPTSRCSPPRARGAATRPSSSASVPRRRWRVPARSTSSGRRSRGSPRCSSGPRSTGERHRRDARRATDRESTPRLESLRVDRRRAAPPARLRRVRRRPARLVDRDDASARRPSRDDERLVRATPRDRSRRRRGAAALLAELTGRAVERCADGDPSDALRAGYASEPPGDRVPGLRLPPPPVLQPRRDRLRVARAAADRAPHTTRSSSSSPATARAPSLPLAFCRECGQEYYSVRTRERREGSTGLEPRATERHDGDDDESRRLPLRRASDKPWPDDPRPRSSASRTTGSSRRAGASASKRPPQAPAARHRARPDGRFGRRRGSLPLGPGAVPLLPRLRGSYGGRQPRDFGKLATLGAGGRSARRRSSASRRSARCAGRREA